MAAVRIEDHKKVTVSSITMLPRNTKFPGQHQTWTQWSYSVVKWALGF